MKKTLLLLLVWLLQTNPATAQGPGDYQFQFQFDNFLSEWVQGPDGAWFGVGWSRTYPGFPYAQPFVIKWDPATDSMLWKVTIDVPYAEVIWDMALLPTPGGGAYVATVADGCDYPTQEGMASLDATGNVLWETQLPNDHRQNYKAWLLPGLNGDILFQTEKAQFVFSPAGILSNVNNTPFGWNGIAQSSAGNYLTYGNQKLGFFNSSSSLPFPENVRHADQTDTGEWLVLGSNKLYRLNAALDVLSENALPHLAPWSKVFCSDGTCWVTGETNATASVLHRIDPLTLDLQATYQYDKQYQVLSVLHRPGDTMLWLSGNCNFERNQTVFLKAVPKDSPAILPTKSVSLENVRLEKTPVYHPPFLCASPAGYKSMIQFGPIFVTVRNTGSLPVSTFLVNGRFNDCWFICYREDQYSAAFAHPLDPGESVELLMYGDLFLTGPPNATAFDLCFWTALPDDRLDAIPDDDRYCKSFSVLVSDKEADAVEHAVRVSPNPARDRAVFSVETPDADFARYRITFSNATGQTVLQTAFTGPNWTLEAGDMPTGLYFYHITGPEDLIGSGRLVISR